MDGPVVNQDIPGDIAEFLGRHIDSVVQLEILLLAFKSPNRVLVTGEVAHELRIDPSWTEAALTKLVSAGALQKRDPGFRFAANNHPMFRTISDLAALYETRRVSIISLIFSKPADPIRQFTDAFRFRKENEA